MILSRGALTPLGNDRWRVAKVIRYKSPRVASVIRVPEGFETDTESVPRWLPLIYAWLKEASPVGGCVHDWLYSQQLTSRAVADAILFDIILEDGNNRAEAWATWLGVRLGGWLPYNRYAAESVSGSPK